VRDSLITWVAGITGTPSVRVTLEREPPPCRLIAFLVDLGSYFGTARRTNVCA